MISSTSDARRMFRWLTMRRYLLLHIPEWTFVVVVAVFVGNREWLAPHWIIGIAVLWIVKDLAIYPIVWKSYMPAELADADAPLYHQSGEVIEKLSPLGRVKVAGCFWKARAVDQSDEMDPGTPVRVVREEGQTLVVERIIRTDS